jgi:hypothetical protein
LIILSPSSFFPSSSKLSPSHILKPVIHRLISSSDCTTLQIHDVSLPLRADSKQPNQISTLISQFSNNIEEWEA